MLLWSVSFSFFLRPNLCLGHQEFWESVNPSAAALPSWCRGHEDLPHLVRVPGPAGLQELHPPHYPPGNGHPPARRQPQQSLGYHTCMHTLHVMFYTDQVIENRWRHDVTSHHMTHHLQHVSVPVHIHISPLCSNCYSQGYLRYATKLQNGTTKARIICK